MVFGINTYQLLHCILFISTQGWIYRIHFHYYHIIFYPCQPPVYCSSIFIYVPILCDGILPQKKANIPFCLTREISNYYYFAHPVNYRSVPIQSRYIYISNRHVHINRYTTLLPISMLLTFCRWAFDECSFFYRSCLFRAL